MTFEELSALQYPIDADGHARLQRFVEQLLAENQRLNLTAIRSTKAVWTRHICDSLALLPLLDASEARSVADVGSGGGIPGLPLACVRTSVEFTLVDSTAKKMAAVQRMAESIGLTNVRCIPERAEVLGNDRRYRERFDGVVARAVGPLSPLVEWVAGLVRPGGQCWLFKSLQQLQPEIDAAARAAELCNLDYEDAYAYDLPDDAGTRAIVIYSKIERLPAALPRPPWRAKGKPLR